MNSLQRSITTIFPSEVMYATHLLWESGVKPSDRIFAVHINRLIADDELI